MKLHVFRQRWKQARKLGQQLGIINAFLYGMSRALSAVTGGRVRILRYYIVAQPIGREPRTAMRPDPRTRIETYTAGHAGHPSFPRPAEVIDRRFTAGATCLCATVNGAFAGYLWWQRDRYDEDEVRCEFVLTEPGRSVWDFDVYVEPQFRLSRTLARLWAEADARLASDGVRWSFSRISAFNPESLAAHARLGLIRCDSAVFLLAGNFQLSLSSRYPFGHWSCADDSRPTVRLAVPKPSVAVSKDSVAAR